MSWYSSTVRLRPSLLVLTGIAATFAFAGTAPVFRAAYARSTLPTRAAEWIWSGDSRREKVPSAFWAARDFTLDAVPKRAVLYMQADPEYVLWLNGRRIGAGRFAAGAPLDGYEVTPLLQVGTNRLLAELRSDHGAGGFLLSLNEGSNGRQLLASDPSWTILRRDDPNLLRGFRPLEGGTPAYSWSYPPTGRWGRPRLGAVQPLRFERPTLNPPTSAPSRSGVAGRAVRFDWGAEPTVGRLALEVVPQEAIQVAVLRVEEGGEIDPTAISVILMPNQSVWLEPQVRRFRAVEIVGTLKIEAARVLSPDGPEDRVAQPTGPPKGLLGLAPPPLRTPVEDEVGRQLERLPHL
ncbi:MAG TPA: hypothetical protein VGS22_24130 [Thermoanaerobaculia bacterium]|nr:hypothetical protein [Thermoanaerobaculia bacterium]